ncbi:hypothetical protein U8V72_24745 [Priestia filamentosa]|uniref:hypothetical protein n=1 Tax=Priestia filamentosa TaxID=1402861 RepID=UPI00397BFEB9
MKACDYLIDEQHETEVQCFYSPFFAEKENKEKYTWHTGGSLKTFKTGDTLPLETLYYSYPDDFCIVLNPVANPYQLALVEKGKFIGFIKDALDAPEHITSFYTFKGYKTRAQNSKEAKQYIEEYQQQIDKEKPNLSELTLKWIEPLTSEQKLGELVDCYVWARNNPEDERFEDDPHYIEDILLSIKEFAEENPHTFTSFVSKHKIQI